MDIDITKVTRKASKEKRTIAVNIKVSPSESEWMSKRNVSPSLLFRESLKQLMDEEKKISRVLTSPLVDSDGRIVDGFKPVKTLKDCARDIKQNHPFKKNDNRFKRGIKDSVRRQR